jgi:hypothetical protein
MKTCGLAIVSPEAATAVLVKDGKVALRPRVSLNGSELEIACSLTFVAPHASTFIIKEREIVLRVANPSIGRELKEARSLPIVLW